LQEILQKWGKRAADRLRIIHGNDKKTAEFLVSFSGRTEEVFIE